MLDVERWKIIIIQRESEGIDKCTSHKKRKEELWRRILKKWNSLFMSSLPRGFGDFVTQSLSIYLINTVK